MRVLYNVLTLTWAYIMTESERNQLKTKVWTFGAKCVVFGSRSKICEQQGIDTDKDFICVEVRKDMDQLESEIYQVIDKL